MSISFLSSPSLRSLWLHPPKHHPLASNAGLHLLFESVYFVYVRVDLYVWYMHEHLCVQVVMEAKEVGCPALSLSTISFWDGVSGWPRARLEAHKLQRSFCFCPPYFPQCWSYKNTCNYTWFLPCGDSNPSPSSLHIISVNPSPSLSDTIFVWVQKGVEINGKGMTL